MGPSSGAHHAQHRAAGGGGGSGSSSSGQAPPPATQWAAFKRALASEQRFDYCYWISVSERKAGHVNGICVRVR